MNVRGFASFHGLSACTTGPAIPGASGHSHRVRCRTSRDNGHSHALDGLGLVDKCASDEVEDPIGNCVKLNTIGCPSGQVRNVIGTCVPTSFSIPTSPTQLDVDTAAPCPLGQSRNLLGQCVPSSFSIGVPQLNPPTAPTRSPALPPPPAGGLSTGAKVGIAAGVVGLLVLVAR